MTVSPSNPQLAVTAAAEVDAGRAQALSRQLGLPLLPAGSDPARVSDYHCVVWVAASGLSLRQCGPGAPGPVAVEFGSNAMRYRRRGGQSELLGRAIGVGGKPGLSVVDATAGLGRDAFVLADLGCRVLLCEREPVVATLLSDALERCAEDADPWLREVVSRMRLFSGDVRLCPPDHRRAVEVYYLDPMFPPRNKSAAVKKEMVLMRRLFERPDQQADEARLLEWSLAQDCARVVVKRPARAPCLAERKPSFQLRGKAVRFDVYVRRALACPG